VKIATPAFNISWPSVVPVVESLNVTLPVGVLDRPNDAMLAVNVTSSPSVDGFGLAVKVVVLAKLVGYLWPEAEVIVAPLTGLPLESTTLIARTLLPPGSCSQYRRTKNHHRSWEAHK
jgi:hypothetical protein